MEPINGSWLLHFLNTENTIQDLVNCTSERGPKPWWPSIIVHICRPEVSSQYMYNSGYCPLCLHQSSANTYWDQGLSSLNSKDVLPSVGNSHRPVSPRPTTLKEDRELFVDFSSNFMFMIWDSRHEDLQLFGLSFKHWSYHHAYNAKSWSWDIWELLNHSDICQASRE